MESHDLKHLERCLELAQEAAKRDEVPVGALIVDNQTGIILSEASNRREELKSPLGHAELLAIEDACKKRSSWRLTGTTLYSSLEPCVMCSGAIIQARIDRVIFSTDDIKGGGQSLFELFDGPNLNHQVSWKQGPLAEDNKQLLQSFFKKKRQNHASK